MIAALSRARAGLAARTPDLLVAALAGATAVVGSYAVAGFTTEFVAGPIAGVLARRMPAAVINFAIVVLGDLGQTLNLLTALGLAWGAFAVVAYLGLALGERVASALDDRSDGGALDVGGPDGGTLDVGSSDAPTIADGRSGSLFGAAAAAIGTTAVAFAVTGAGFASVGAGLSSGLVLLAAALLTPVEGVGFSPRRRRVLGGAGSAALLGIGGYFAGSLGLLRTRTVEAGRPLVGTAENGPRVRDLADEAASQSLDVSGLEPLVSTDFYQVDINQTDPRVPADDWQLTVTGDVGQEVTYDYEELRALESENRFVTLRCVGEDLNGRKLDNAVWTGVRMMDVIEPAEIPDRCCVMLHATDGYRVEFPLSALEDAFLAYGMNDTTLPVGHGYPVRALIPGRWGETNVKWIEEIEVLAEPEDGYWEQRGWQGTGPVNTVAKLHVENHLDDGRVEVAGHAYAGTRGVERVEVSTDGGETWSDATLSEPLPGDDVWRQWVHRYDPPGGAHEVVVRAVDGTGEVQVRERNESFPSGATGWVSRQIDA